LVSLTALIVNAAGVIVPVAVSGVTV